MRTKKSPSQAPAMASGEQYHRPKTVSRDIPGDTPTNNITISHPPEGGCDIVWCGRWGCGDTKRGTPQACGVVISVKYPKLDELSYRRFRSYITPVKRGRWVCWVWTGKTDRFGYGRFWYRGRWASAHVIAYTFLNREASTPARAGRVRRIPARTPQLDHLCNHTSCVRPSHLEPVTSKTNHERRISRWLASKPNRTPSSARRSQARLGLRAKSNARSVASRS